MHLVRKWHLADIQVPPESGHQRPPIQCLLLSQSGRRRVLSSRQERDADQFRFQFGRSAMTLQRAGLAGGPGPLDSPPAPNGRGHSLHSSPGNPSLNGRFTMSHASFEVKGSGESRDGIGSRWGLVARGWCIRGSRWCGRRYTDREHCTNYHLWRGRNLGRQPRDFLCLRQ
jgi:hypothetical protein